MSATPQWTAQPGPIQGQKVSMRHLLDPRTMQVVMPSTTKTSRHPERLKLIQTLALPEPLASERSAATFVGHRAILPSKFLRCSPRCLNRPFRVLISQRARARTTADLARLNSHGELRASRHPLLALMTDLPTPARSIQLNDRARRPGLLTGRDQPTVLLEDQPLPAADARRRSLKLQ